MILKMLLHHLRLVKLERNELIFEVEMSHEPVVTLQTHYKENMPIVQKAEVFVDGHGLMRG